MKKLLSIIGIAALAVVINLNADTYTNGMLSARLPVSDQQLEQIKVLRRYVGDTNTPLAHFMTNCIQVELTPDSKQILANLKSEIAQKVRACDDEVMLLRIKNWLDAVE